VSSALMPRNTQRSVATSPADYTEESQMSHKDHEEGHMVPSVFKLKIMSIMCCCNTGRFAYSIFTE